MTIPIEILHRVKVTRMLLFLLLLANFKLYSQPTSDTQLTSTQWASDIRHLSHEMKNIHPNLFHGISEQAFDSQVENLLSGINNLSADQIKVELLRLMAAISRSNGKDGHSRFIPTQEKTGFTFLPLRLYWFEDGCFVVNSMLDGSLAGHQLLSIGNTPIDEVYQRLDDLIPRDNEMTVKAWMPLYAMIPEILSVAGIVSQPDLVTMEFYNPMTQEKYSRKIKPVRWQEFKTWSQNQPETEKLTWRFVRHSKTPFEYKLIDGCIYFGYHAVRSKNEEGKALKAVVKEMERLIEDGKATGLIIDVRDNQGGNNETYAPFLKMIKRSSINDREKLFIICGRNTFSAAGNFVTEMALTTNVTLVGESMGGGLNQYGDSRRILLPHSGLELRISSRYHQKSDANDDRLTLPVDIFAPLSSEDYFNDRDPALNALERKLNKKLVSE